MKIAEMRGVPIFIHWSLPAGGLVISVWAGFDLREAAYYCLAYTMLVAAHELGHVVAARSSGLKVIDVEISGVGGLCHVQRPRRLREAYLVYSGGVLAQLVLLALTLSYLAAYGQPTSVFGRCMVATFTLFNVLVLIMNLIPRKSPGRLASDGHVLFELWTTNGREILASEDVTVVFPPDTSLLSVDGFLPEGFATGLEILNDRTTPMDFVIDVLTKNLEQEREQAVKTMLAIHRTGGLLLALPSYERAEAIAQAITREARERGHPLVCRAVRRQQNDAQPPAAADAPQAARR